MLAGMATCCALHITALNRRQLEEWLDLSLSRGMPSSLLLLSRAFTITAATRDEEEKQKQQIDSIKQTLSTLPDEAIEDVEYESINHEQEDRAAVLEKKLRDLK